MKIQNESEQHYLRLEDKMMEVEERREENREFQLQMMGLLCKVWSGNMGNHQIQVVSSRPDSTTTIPCIIESVDSISRDGLDTPIHIMHYKKPNYSTQLYFYSLKLSNP